MSIESLVGRHFRLRQELAIAYRAVPWNTGRIDRLTAELASTEQQIMGAPQLSEIVDGSVARSVMPSVSRSAVVSMPAVVPGR